MHDETNNTDNGQSNMSPENSAHLRDLLISRVIDGSANADDWSAFRTLASSDGSVWEELSIAQSEHEALGEVMHAASAIADGVELPIHAVGGAAAFESRVSSAVRWGGWAIAAVLLFGWFTGAITMNPDSNNSGPVQAGLNIPLTQADPEQAFGQYLQAGQSNGQVVGEMPDHVVVETRPLVDGTIEVIYLRQVIERRVLNQAFREAVDEFGNPVVVPVDLKDLKHRSSF